MTPFKQRQISKAALTWLAKKGQLEVCARFDVISITFIGQQPQIEHIPNAFELAYWPGNTVESGTLLCYLCAKKRGIKPWILLSHWLS